MNAAEAVFDELIHFPARLRICGLLKHAEAVAFRTLEDALQLPASQVSRHLKALTEAGYVTVSKTPSADRSDARRVACAEQHSWRAVSVVELAGTGPDGEDYPGEQAAQERGQEPCEQVGRDRATDPLEFTWGYEWPSAEQWAAGQRFGRCWVPVA